MLLTVSTFCHLVGLALQPQILPVGEKIPTNEDDWRVDQVMTVDD